MNPGTLLPVAVIASLVAALAALIVAVLAVRAARSSVERSASRLAEEQAQSLRWVSSQLAETMDRFHGQLAEFGHQVAASQGSASEAVQSSLHRELSSLRESVGSQLNASQQTLGQGLANATETFGSLQNRLGEVSEMAGRMAQLAASVEQLGSILTVPKLRGLMGEQTLELMLRQVLPERLWSSQHRFADGRVVDAIVRLGERILPVDAKFPLESYRRLVEASEDQSRGAARRDFVRAVRARVEEIASRYIRPSEGTTDFALMFIPAEGVYGELLAAVDGSGGLLDDALAKRVVPVSPASLFAYLSVVASGLRGLEVEARTREIVDTITTVEQEVGRLQDEMAVLGRHIHNAAQKQGEVEGRLQKVSAHLAELGRWTDGGG